jgi:MFS family permease
MFPAIRPVRSLLLAIFVMMAGSGFMATLVSLRLEAAGYAPLAIGLVGAAYFAGLTVGSLTVGQVIRRVGHIRAFAAFVAVLSASTLAYAIHQDMPFWAGLRLIDGLCVAGVYVCLESWLGDRSEPATRGAVLAAYMVALYSGQGLGQFLLNVSDDKPSMPFVVASMLTSLSILPIALTRSSSPTLGEYQPLTLRRLYAVSPLGVVGAAVTGLALGAFYGLGAVHVRRLGVDVSGAALFMSAVIFGGVALQLPLGRLSDRFDRRRVIVGVFAAATAVSAAIAMTTVPGSLLLLLGALFGGLTFSLYPLCVAHANDHVSADQRVGASGGLVLVYSAGAAAGPLAGAGAMTFVEPGGLFLFIAVCAVLAVAFALWRLAARQSPPQERQRAWVVLPRTTPMSAALDPLGSRVRELRRKRGFRVDPPWRRR